MCCLVARSVYLNIPGMLVINALAGLVGLVVYAHYASVNCDPLRAGFIANSNQVSVNSTGQL